VKILNRSSNSLNLGPVLVGTRTGDLHEEETRTFTGPSRGVNKNEAPPHINKDSTPFSVLMLYFTGAVQLLVEQTNLYHRQYCDSRDDGPSSPFPVDDLTMSDMLLFLAVTLQMGHDIRDPLKGYWSTLEHLHTPCYSNTMIFGFSW
jgi:hypothetical protein